MAFFPLRFALAILTSTGALVAQMDRIELKTTHVAGPVFLLEGGSGGNIGVSVGDDGILIVDDQFAPLAEKIRAALRQLSDGKLVFLLNTHHHFDHTGGNAVFGEEALIIAHENVRTRLAKPQNHEKSALPIVTFGDSLSIFFNGEEIRMLHFPHGHTDNDSVIFFTGSRVVHMGDLLFTDSFPSFYPSDGGDIEGYAKNVGSILELLPAGAKIIAGHGRLASVEDVEAFHRMLVETIAIVRQRIAAGMTMEEARDAGLPEQYHRFANTYTSVATWITKLYTNLAD
jgi:glyoxylase-like metal-dependent hydrolase (beta-lactamase superfamily II)